MTPTEAKLYKLMNQFQAAKERRLAALVKAEQEMDNMYQAQVQARELGVNREEFHRLLDADNAAQAAQLAKWKEEAERV